MVSKSQILACNAQVDESSLPRVAVFFGATSGIGKLTLGALVRLGLPIKAYVVGRPETADAFRPVLDEMKVENPKANIVWLEGQPTLLSETKRMCDEIKANESAVDLLFMTAGYAPFGGRNDTSEGIDASHALEYYSRMAFVLNLLPLLRASGRARVVSVLAGGLESPSKLAADDLHLERPGAFGAVATQAQMGAMGTLALERLAEDDENAGVVFVHSYPGAVATGNLARGWKAGSWTPRILTAALHPVIAVVGFSFEESAARHLYIVVSGTFGGKGPTIPGVVGQTTKGKSKGGLFLVNQNCDTVLNEKNLAELRVSAQEKVWVKTQEVLRQYL